MPATRLLSHAVGSVCGSNFVWTLFGLPCGGLQSLADQTSHIDEKGLVPKVAKSRKPYILSFFGIARQKCWCRPGATCLRPHLRLRIGWNSQKVQTFGAFFTVCAGVTENERKPQTVKQFHQNKVSLRGELFVAGVKGLSVGWCTRVWCAVKIDFLWNA